MQYNFRTNAYDGQQVSLMGYGTTDFGGAYSNVLKSAVVNVISNGQCQNTYGNEVTAQDSCTLSTTSRNDSCQVSFFSFH